MNESQTRTFKWIAGYAEHSPLTILIQLSHAKWLSFRKQINRWTEHTVGDNIVATENYRARCKRLQLHALPHSLIDAGQGV